MLSNLKVSEDWVLLDAGEEDPHGVGSVIQEGNSNAIKVTGELVNVGLKFGKSWEERKAK